MPSQKQPRLANWLLSKMVGEEFQEEFFGDLQEIYEDRVATKSKFYAKCMYWVDALHLLFGFSSFKIFNGQTQYGVFSHLDCQFGQRTPSEPNIKYTIHKRI